MESLISLFFRLHDVAMTRLSASLHTQLVLVERVTLSRFFIITPVNIMKVHRSSHQRCQSFFFNKVVGLFFKKETLAQVFSCEFSEISKNTFFTEHLWTIASEYTTF